MTAETHTHSDGTNPQTRVRGRVGLEPKPNRSDAGTHSRPILDGNSDTRGLVSDEERAHLQTFGSEVRTMRKAAGLSQERLGKLAGIGTTHIGRLEQGRRRPSVDAIKALARILAPAGTTDAVEQHLGALAGDSLREGAARRKRRVENKHRREAAAELNRMTRKLTRLIADKERRGLPVPDSLRRMAALDLSARLQPIDDPGITGIEPVPTARDTHEEVQGLIRSMTRRRR